MTKSEHPDGPVPDDDYFIDSPVVITGEDIGPDPIPVTVIDDEHLGMFSDVEQGRWDDDPNPYHGDDTDGLIGGDSDLWNEGD